MALTGSGRKDLAAFLGSECLNEGICHPCYGEGKQLEAVGFCVNCQEPLCAECYKYHTRPTITKHHELVERKQNSKNTLRNTWKKRSWPKSKTHEKCEEHKEKNVKYFCPKHDFLGCSVCVTLCHRLCEDMVYIPDVSSEIMESEEYREFQSKLRKIASNSVELLNETKQRNTLVDDCNAKALAAVDEFRKQINEVLNDIAYDMKTKMRQIKEEELEEMTKTSENINETASEAKLISHQFRLLINEKQYSSMYIAMKRAKDRLRELEQETLMAEKELKRAKVVKEYVFEPAMEILEQIRTYTKFGTITFKDTQVAQEDNINVKTESDTMECWISGSTVLPNNTIIVADRNNRKLKMIDTQQNEITSEMQLTARPWDVTNVNDTQVVVSLPNRKKLSFVNTEPELKLDHDLTVKDPCYGLVCCNDKLIVANAVHHKVEILNLDGTAIKSISKSDRGLQLFLTPCYVALNPDKTLMYVSSSGNNTVTCLTLEGKLVASYADEEVKFLRQLITDETGKVYVSGAKSNIHQITADCRLVKTLLGGYSEDNFQPFSICYDKGTKKLFVGMENRDSMKVFKIAHAESD